MKQVVKNVESSDMTAVVRSRTVPASVISHFVAKIKSQEDAIEEIKQAEVVARMDRLAEMEVVRAQNLIEHADEIKARPQREWFATNAQKLSKKEDILEKKRKIEEAAGTGTHRMSRKKRRKREAMKALLSPNDAGEGPDEGKPKKNIALKLKVDARDEKRKKNEKSTGRVKEFNSDKKKTNKKKSVITSEYSLGDSSLFNDDKDNFSTKPKEKKDTTADAVAKSPYKSRDEKFDSDKKLGKKKGHKQFKSKTKFKRR
jgi:hypothetical protein